MPVLIRNILLGLAVLLVQWLIAGRLQIWGAYADVALIFLTLQALRHGRLAGSIAGLGLGLGLDVVYGTWGIQMFTKTLVGFLIGMFSDDERGDPYFTPSQAAAGMLVIALVHNGLMVALHALDAGTRNLFMIAALWLGSSVYTAVVAGIGAPFYSSR